MSTAPVGLSLGLAFWLGLLQTPCYGEVAALRPTIEALSAVESRLAGYPGAEAGAALVERELVAAGVEAVRRDSFAVVVPIERGARLRLEPSGEEVPLWGLWPNLARTVTLPPEGLRAPMIYGGRGEWSDFDGHAMDGRIILLEFDSWNHWLHAASLGARAVVFIAPEQANRHQAAAKYAHVPLDIPRFWVEREAGLMLRQRLRDGELLVHLQGRMDWQWRTAWNIWGVIPGADPELADERVAIEAYYDGISVVPGRAPSAELSLIHI